MIILVHNVVISYQNPNRDLDALTCVLSNLYVNLLDLSDKLELLVVGDLFTNIESGEKVRE